MWTALATTVWLLLFVLVLVLLNHGGGLVQAWKRPWTRSKVATTTKRAGDSQPFLRWTWKKPSPPTSKRQRAIVESATKKVQAAQTKMHKTVQQGVTTIQRSAKQAQSSVQDNAATWNRQTKKTAVTKANDFQQAAGKTAKQVRETLATAAQDGLERTRASIHETTRPPQKKQKQKWNLPWRYQK